MQCSLVAALAIVLLTAGVNSANAGIIVLDETTFTTGFNKSSTHTFTNDALGGFDVTGYDKLVFVASSEGIDNLLSVTYGGVALTEAVTAASANRGSFIYYLDNPTVNGDLFVQGDSSGNGIGGTLFGLTGTQAGVGNTDTAGSGSSNATNVATFNASLGSIVIGSGTGNNNAAVVDAPQTAITFGLNVARHFIARAINSLIQRAAWTPAFQPPGLLRRRSFWRLHPRTRVAGDAWRGRADAAYNPPPPLRSRARADRIRQEHGEKGGSHQ